MVWLSFSELQIGPERPQQPINKWPKLGFRRIYWICIDIDYYTRRYGSDLVPFRWSVDYIVAKFIKSNLNGIETRHCLSSILKLSNEYLIM